MNGRINWTENKSFSGLASSRFLIPATHPNTPFSVPVYIALSDASRPLKNVSETTNATLATTLNATLGTWNAAVVARYEQRERSFDTEFAGSVGAAVTVDPAVNPFSGTLASLIPISSRSNRSKTSTTLLSADAQGPLVELWAGPVQARLGASAGWVDLDAFDQSGNRTFDRHEYMAKGGITVPLSSVERGFLSGLGDSEVAFDIGRVDLGQYGTLKRYSIALNWQPVKWLRFAASEVHDENPIFPELLAAPENLTPNVPYFDPLTGQTVDVTTIYGGAGGLLPEELRTRTLSATANPLPKYRLQLNADYIVTDLENQIGALPPPSSAVVAAFPERFVRDSTGTLILVDNRSVNFARQLSRSLRLGASFSVPLTEAVVVPADREAGTARRRVPGLTLQVNGSHTYLLENTTVIREGLPEVDLLEGGAIGIGGGRPRHSTNFNLALTKGGTGVRASLRQRGISYLVIGSAMTPDRLIFESLTTLDIRAFADLGQLLPNNPLAKGSRLTVVFDNLFNDRQRVTNSAGSTPQAYQPAYRDPIGRTIMVELRKVF
jgi:iron complex outermembrane recepter protein